MGFHFRVLSVVMAAGLAAALFFMWLLPAMKTSCLVYSEKCLRVDYRSLGTTILMNTSAGQWMWYDGELLLIYNLPSGDICAEGTPVYMWNVPTAEPLGFFCGKSLRDVQHIYSVVPMRRTYIYTDRTPTAVELLDYILQIK